MFRTTQGPEKFSEINATGVYISKTNANYTDSMALLQQNGFRPLTYPEALVKIGQSPELKKQLKGEWFYLDGKGSALSGDYTFNDKGELTQGKGDVEKTVHVCKGSQPLKLYVHYTDRDARNLGWWFGLGAYTDPSLVARVVVGVVATPKIEVSNVEEGVKLTGVTTEQLMALQRDSVQELSIQKM